MFKMDYAVVRVSGEPTPSVSRGRGPIPEPSVAGDYGEVKVKIDRVSAAPQELSDIRREEGVKLAVPLMPLSLIEPRPSSVTLPASGPTWGLEAVRATTSPFRGEGITVAVLDTGIDANHVAFHGVDLVEEDFAGAGNGDTHGHGTHCAGTIFGRDVDGVRIGVAPEVPRALIGRVFGPTGTTQSILDAINWAVSNGANVISMSLGFDFPRLVWELQDQGIPEPQAVSMGLSAYRDNVRSFDAVASLAKQIARSRNASLICAATGNESNRIASDEAPIEFVIEAAPPSTAEGILAIGALEKVDGGYGVASFSNTSPDLSGPGADVVSAASGGGLRSLSGTSMATPHVAGVAALWAEKLAKEGSLTSDQLMARVLASVESLPLAFGDVGGGLVRAPQT